MTGREQDRRHRRGEPSGGSPSRRTDRIRRPTEKHSDKTGEKPVRRSAPAESRGDEPQARRAGRRAVRRGSASRVLGQVLGRLTTRRAALLALVVCGLALSIAVPLHTYVSQRDDLRDQMRQQQVLRAQESALEKREQQLSDPAQVEAEVRTRLHYVMPGETPYVVQLPGDAQPAGQAPSHGSVPGSSWYQMLWNSVVGSNG